MYVHYNPNPAGRLVGDCSIRAIAKALNVDWESAYALVTKAGFLMGDMPSVKGRKIPMPIPASNCLPITSS